MDVLSLKKTYLLNISNHVITSKFFNDQVREERKPEPDHLAKETSKKSPTYFRQSAGRQKVEQNDSGNIVKPALPGAVVIYHKVREVN